MPFMSVLDSFAVTESHAVFRPVGCVSLQQAVQMVLSAILHAREQNIRNLVTDLLGLTGFESPSVPVRFQFIKEWAQAAGGFVRLAMVVRPEMIDPQKIGVLVGRHHGLVCDVFPTEPDALAWIRGIS
jgi:hypothetical protein